MSLYCLKCHTWTTDKALRPCNTKHLVSATENMLPILLKAHNLGLQVASAFCITETHSRSTLVQAELNFNCVYPEELLQDLPQEWYWSDYITLENKRICSSLVYDVEYNNTNTMSLDEFVQSAIRDLLLYLSTRDRDGLRAIMLLSNT